VAEAVAVVEEAVEEAVAEAVAVVEEAVEEAVVAVAVERNWTT